MGLIGERMRSQKAIGFYLRRVNKEAESVGPDLCRVDDWLFSHSPRLCARVREVAVGGSDES